MALEFIKNQPIIFEDDRDDCANNDTKVYDVLAQGTDRIYLQFKQTPCDGDDLLCDVLVTGGTGELITNGTFTGAATGWTLAGTATYNANKIDFTAGSGSIRQAVGMTMGRIVKIIFTISNYTAGTLSVTLAAGGAPGGLSKSATGNGTHTKYIRFSSGIDNIMFHSTNFAGSIDDVSVQFVDSCYQYGGTGSAGWFNEGSGIFHLASSTSKLELLSTPLLANNLYKIAMTVTGRTTGSILITAGADASNTIDRNGSFIFYVDTGGAIPYEITPTADFDGTITQWETYELSNDHYIQILDMDGNAISHNYTAEDAEDPITYFEDYVTWSFTPSSIQTGSGEATLEPGCYRLLVHDECTDDYTQVNKINYAGLNNTWKCSKTVIGICDGKAFGFEFENSGFKLQQRLMCTWFNSRYPKEGDEYFYSNGTHKKLYVQVQKIRTLLFNYVDEPTHDCISKQVECDTFTVDGTEYHIPFKDYEPEWNPNGRLNLAQSRVEMQAKTDVLFNKSC